MQKRQTYEKVAVGDRCEIRRQNIGARFRASSLSCYRGPV